MEALLDNPIWSALTTDHAYLALGGDLARRYPAEIGPLTGIPAQTEASYDALRPLAGAGGLVGLFLTEEPRLPAGWNMVRGGLLDQMMAERPDLVRVQLSGGALIRPLTPADAPAMVALAELTNPVRSGFGRLSWARSSASLTAIGCWRWPDSGYGCRALSRSAASARILTRGDAATRGC